MTSGNLQILVDALLQTETKNDMKALLCGLLTQKELEELPRRLEIFKLLKKDVPQHEIAHKLGVGIATVTRGSHELQRGYIQKTSWWHNQNPL